MCFIRINPSTAPLNPPGAAPTLTTIYDEAAAVSATTTTSPPSPSLPQDPPPPNRKQKSKRLKRSNNPFVAKPAKDGVEGTEKEKRRTQIIADSLDLGGDLQTYVEGGGKKVVGEGESEGDEMAGGR